MRVPLGLKTYFYPNETFLTDKLINKKIDFIDRLYTVLHEAGS
jgi:hypothetical protein